MKNRLVIMLEIQVAHASRLWHTGSLNEWVEKFPSY